MLTADLPRKGGPTTCLHFLTSSKICTYRRACRPNDPAVLAHKVARQLRLIGAFIGASLLLARLKPCPSTARAPTLRSHPNLAKDAPLRWATRPGRNDRMKKRAHGMSAPSLFQRKNQSYGRASVTLVRPEEAASLAPSPPKQARTSCEPAPPSCAAVTPDNTAVAWPLAGASAAVPRRFKFSA